MLALPFDRLLGSLGETLVMTVVSGAISFAVGLPLGLVLVGTAPGGVLGKPMGQRKCRRDRQRLPLAAVHHSPGRGDSAHASIGTAAAIVPLSISGIPYFGRVAEVALREVDRGLIEAVRAMGGGNWTIIREALVPEALPSLIAGFTVTLVLLVGASAMAGAVGAGGLGDLAIRYGYQRFETSVMIAVIVVLIALVALIQAGGEPVARTVDPR